MKKYVYSKPDLWVSIILPVFLMMGLFLWAIYRSLMEGPLPFYQLLIITMPLLLLSTLMGLHNPSSVTVTTNSIIFEGFGRKHEYLWEDIEGLSVKNYGYAGKSFIRIGKYRLFGGRYWISNKMHGYKELLNFLQTKFGQLG
ncbi:hypothetical protein [uncultured Metabacillus sp.]|uniref:hypothetical protein n=1 Tax=uncultured Metabacillus sp. TaxID=2860135 RepID=UPI002609E42C|nr:hypothetical protein [uncultured Metabacillus sp.]